MPKLLANEEISLNGVMENPQDWPRFSSPDFEQDMGTFLQGEGALLFGRVTYELMERSWAGQDNPIGQFMDRTQKYVVSGRLTAPTWERTTVLSDEPLEQLRDLKATLPGDLVLLGSLTLLGSLLDAGLVDTLQFTVHPVLAQGRSFPQGSDLGAFRLQSHRSYQGGLSRVILAR